MFKKISLPVLVTVMCLMMAAVVGLVYLNQKNQKKVKVAQKTNSEVTRTDYSGVARKTLDWIDKQRNDEGWYILERGCDFNKKTCDTVWDNQEGNKDGLIATWSRFNFYQQTKEAKDLAIVKSDINKFYEKYPNGVDNSLWICKITYEMWKSNVFDQTTKDKLEKICFNSKLANSKNLFDEFTARNSAKDKVAKNKETWSSWDGYSLLLRGFNAYTVSSTDLVYKYLWKNDLSYLDSAKKNFYEAKYIVDKEQTFSAGDKCLLAMSALDIYEAGKEEKYFLEYAENLYDTLVINSDAPRKVTTPTCGLLTKRLLELTEDQKYLKNLEFFNNVLVKFNYDGGVNVIASDNSFYKSDKGLVYTWYKDVVENGLMVELLRN